MLEKKGEQYPLLTVTPQGREWLKGGEQLLLLSYQEVNGERRQKKSLDYDSVLFEQLRQFRKEIAHERGVPPFMIFSDVSLQEMCFYFPVSDEDFLSITGVGEQKLESFGDRFVRMIQAYVKENNIVPIAQKIHTRRSTSSRATTGNHLRTQALLAQKMSLEAIAHKQ